MSKNRRRGTSYQGNPIVSLRLPAGAVEDLKELAVERYGPGRGIAGGVSRLIRELVYRELGRELPPQYLEERRKDK